MLEMKIPSLSRSQAEDTVMWENYQISGGESEIQSGDEDNS